MYQLIGLVQITRPHNCFGAAGVTLMGAYLASSAPHLLSPPVMRAILVVWLIVAACNVVNDHQDVTVDSLNKLQRPIPSGRVSRRTAGYLALLLALAALGVAWSLGPWPASSAVAAMILGASYSYHLKSTVLLGNVVVGLLSATTVIYGGMVAGDLTAAVGVASVLVFLFVSTREILKTIADQESDALAGVCTVATHLGTATALRLFQVFAIVFVVAAMLPWFVDLATDRYLYATVPCSLLPTVGVVTLLGLRATDGRFRLSLRVMKFLWFSSLLPIALLK